MSLEFQYNYYSYIVVTINVELAQAQLNCIHAAKVTCIIIDEYKIDTAHSDNLSSPVVCQVFYHKLGINHWKVTLAFFTENKMDVSYTIHSYISFRILK